MLPGVLILAACGVEAGAQEPPTTNQKAVQQIDAELEASRQREAELREQLRALRAELSDADRQWKLRRSARESTEQALSETDQSLKEQQEQLAAARREREAAEQAVAAARKALEAAQQRLADAETKLQQTDAQIAKTHEAVETARAKQQKLSLDLPPLKEESRRAHSAREKLQTAVDALTAELQALDASRQEKQQRIRELLTDSGQWISFAERIAPIFQRSCVPCHDASNPQGQYSMRSYAAVMSEAASGIVVEPGEPDFSPLLQYIEDGWMPHESPRLPDEEIAVVRRWIAAGARLDPQHEPDQPLVRIMPTVDHPEPPARYPTALPVISLAVNQDDHVVASAGYHEVLLWDFKTQQLRGRLQGLAQRIHALEFHPREPLLAVAAGTPGRVGEVRLFDWRTGDRVAAWTLSPDAVFDIGWSPDGQRLAAVTADGSVVVIAHGESPHIIQRHDFHSDWVRALSWSADGQRIITASRDKTSKVLGLADGELQRTFDDHGGAVSDVLSVNNSKHAISLGKDRQLRVWQLDDGKQLHATGGLQREDAFFVAENADRIVVVDGAASLSVFQRANGKRVDGVKVPATWLVSAVGLPGTTQCLLGDESGRILHVDWAEKKVIDEWSAQP